MRKFILYILLFFPLLSLYSKNTINHPVFPRQTPDSVDLSYYSKKNWCLASGQVVGLNLVVWGFDRLILQTEYSKINWNTIKANIQKGFVWDNDQMATNMFSHPYHGSLYYNAARSNGFDFWASGAFTFVGSLMWEVFMENEYPSINDLIATPIGGIALGEVLYRSSDLILNDRATGSERFVREMFAFIVAPTRGLTRIFTGDAWRKRATSGRQFGIPNINFELSIGFRILELRSPILDKGLGLTTHIDLEYGDKFSSDETKPFDYFNIITCINVQKSQPILGQLNVIGRLWSTDIVDKKDHLVSLGIYQHLDYYDSEIISEQSSHIPYKFCTPASVGIGTIYQRYNLENVEFDTYLHLNGVLLGGSLSDYYRVDKRDYNLSAGYSTKFGVNFDFKERIRLSASYEMYKMYTWRGYPDPDIDWKSVDEREFNYQGDKSDAILHAISLRMDVRLKKQFYLTGIFNSYQRRTRYESYADVFSHTSEGRIMLTYKF